MEKNLIERIDWSIIVEDKSELSLYKKVLDDILYYLNCNSRATFQQIVKFVNGSDRRVLRLLDQLVEYNIIYFDYPFFYSREEEDINSLTPDSVRCPSCHSHMISLDNGLDRVSKIMQKIFESRIEPTFVFDQRPVNWQTSVRRVGYMILRGDIKGKEIAVLGDDDLTSIALALTGLAKRVTLFEIDKRITNLVRKLSLEYGFDIEVVDVDLTDGISDEYHYRYDVYTTDPTPTKAPFSTFTDQALLLLKKEEGCIGYSSIYPSCKVLSIDIQKILTEMDFMITDLIPYFTQYDFIEHTYSDGDKTLLSKYASTEEKISFYEYLLRCETTKDTHILGLDFEQEDIIGTATKRVLENPNADPLLSKKGANEDMKKYIDKLKSL